MLYINIEKAVIEESKCKIANRDYPSLDCKWILEELH